VCITLRARGFRGAILLPGQHGVIRPKTDGFIGAFTLKRGPGGPLTQKSAGVKKQLFHSIFRLALRTETDSFQLGSTAWRRIQTWTRRLTSVRYLDGSGGNLEVVQSPQGALSIREVGRGQLMEQLQRHHRAVAATLRLLVQLLLVQENGQGLLSCRINNQWIELVSLSHLNSRHLVNGRVTSFITVQHAMTDYILCVRGFGQQVHFFPIIGNGIRH